MGSPVSRDLGRAGGGRSRASSRSRVETRDDRSPSAGRPFRACSVSPEPGPAPGALVWLGRDFTTFVRTDRTGGYALALGPAGPVRAAATGYFEDAFPGPLVSPGPSFALRPKSFLPGSVADERGRPVAGVEIRARYDTEAVRWADATLRFSGGLTRSRDTGLFRVDRLVPGSGLYPAVRERRIRSQSDRGQGSGAGRTSSRASPDRAVRRAPGRRLHPGPAGQACSRCCGRAATLDPQRRDCADPRASRSIWCSPEGVRPTGTGASICSTSPRERSISRSVPRVSPRRVSPGSRSRMAEVPWTSEWSSWRARRP